MSAVTTILSYALVELKSLWRGRTALIFFIAFPLLLMTILGPAVSGLEAPGAGGRAAVGFAVMFSFMTVNYAGRALYREFFSGTWRQVAMSKPSVLAYVIGKTVTSSGIGLVQLVVFTVLASLLMDLKIEGSFIQFLPVFLLLVIVGSLLGVVLFILTKSIDGFSSLVYLALITFAALGGAIVASSALPVVPRLIGRATPHYWAMRAVDEISSGGGDWSIVLESCAVLLLMAVSLAALIRWRMDYRAEHFGDG